MQRIHCKEKKVERKDHLDRILLIKSFKSKRENSAKYKRNNHKQTLAHIEHQK